MIYFPIVLVLCLFPLNALDDYNASNWQNLQNNKDWKLVKKTKNVDVFSKQLSDFPISAYRVEILSDVNPKILIDAAWLVEKSTEIFPNAYIVDAGIYEQISDTSYTAFQIFNIPFLSTRLYQFNSIRYGNSIYWEKTDTLSKSLNPDKLLLPPINFGSWSAILEGNKSKLTYRVCTNPGGNIPLWIVEQATQRYLPLMLEDIEFYARKMDNKLSN